MTLLSVLIVRLFDSFDLRVKHAFVALIVVTLASWGKERMKNKEFVSALWEYKVAC